MAKYTQRLFEIQLFLLYTSISQEREVINMEKEKKVSSKTHKIKKIREIKDRDKIVRGGNIYYAYVHLSIPIHCRFSSIEMLNIKSCIEYGLKGWKNVLPDMSSTFCDKEHQMCRR